MILALGACAATGTRAGSSASGQKPLTVVWQGANGASRGTMHATLADGRTFTGTYLQVTSQTPSVSAPPELERERNYGWPDWTWGSPETSSTTAPAALYPAAVVADLASAEGTRMHCRFRLNDANAGMKGGGHGQCQVEDDGTLEAVLPGT